MVAHPCAIDVAMESQCWGSDGQVPLDLCDSCQGPVVERAWEKERVAVMGL